MRRPCVHHLLLGNCVIFENDFSLVEEAFRMDACSEEVDVARRELPEELLEGQQHGDRDDSRNVEREDEVESSEVEDVEGQEEGPDDKLGPGTGLLELLPPHRTIKIVISWTRKLFHGDVIIAWKA